MRRVPARRGHFLQIVAGAKHRAIGGNDHHPNRRGRRGIRQRGRQRRHHRLGQGVARGRRVQGKPQDAVTVKVGQNKVLVVIGGYIGHGALQT